MAQTLVPTSTVSSGSWSGSYTDIADSSDSTVIEATEGGGSTYGEWHLTNCTDPLTGADHQIIVRAREQLSGGSNTISIVLVQGGTTIKSSTNQALGTNFSDITLNLSSAEADSITDYNDLRIKLRPDSGYTGIIEVARVRVLVPNLAVPDQVTGVLASNGTYTDKVKVEWNAAARATSYKIYRNTVNSIPGTHSFTDTASPYNDTSAVAPTVYYYWVKGTNSAGDGPASSSNSGWRAEEAPPPVSVIANGVTTTSTNSMVVTAYSDAFGSATPPTGMTAGANATQAGAGSSICLEAEVQTSYKLFAATGATGNFTWTLDPEDVNWASITFALVEGGPQITPAPASAVAKTSGPTVVRGSVTITPAPATAVAKTIISAENRRVRDVFATYNSSTGQYHLFVTKVQMNANAGQGLGATVWANHFTLDDTGAVRRHELKDSFPSAAHVPLAWQSSLESTNYEDRPDSLLVGFWSYGPYPTYNSPVDSGVIWEASLKSMDSDLPDPDSYPRYGVSTNTVSSVTIAPQDFGEPLSTKTLKRVWVTVIPPVGISNQATLTVDVIAHSIDAKKSSLAEKVSRSVTFTGYNSSSLTLRRPARIVYVDFDPAVDPDTSGAEAVSGESFEITISLSGGAGIHAVKIDAVATGLTEAVLSNP